MVKSNRSRLAILISGRGSNMEAILNACKQKDFPAEVSLVISDQNDAKGLETALDAGVPAFAFERKDYDSKPAHEAEIRKCIVANDIDLVCLAGFMRILSAEFVKTLEGRIINIHPRLLPRHKGLDTHARAIAAGDAEHGCTVHYVNAEMDGGEIIAQARIPINPDDTPESLARRVLIEEHKLYPAVVKQLCSS